MKLKANNPALKELRTIHTKKVFNPFSKDSVLKSASDNNKLGKGETVFTKGKWIGLPLYSLSLEERKTCPSDCKLLANCYGNGMWLGHRFKHGAQLQQKLNQELAYLLGKHKEGIVVRLHVLGDFYSTTYVRYWESKLKQYPNLKIFGYTARLTGDIHNELVRVINSYSSRFKIRFSTNKDYSTNEENIIYAADQHGTPNALYCPEQDGRTKSCLSCGLCFGINKTIAFKLH